MSTPGDPGRRQVTANGPLDAVTKAAQLCREHGATSFELRYDAVDRHLPDGVEPRPDEPVKWQAVATWRTRDAFGRRGTRRVIGEAVVDPGQDHGTRGGAAAAMDLLEKLGANVVVIDLTDDTDPRA